MHQFNAAVEVSELSNEFWGIYVSDLSSDLSEFVLYKWHQLWSAFLWHFCYFGVILQMSKHTYFAAIFCQSCSQDHQ